MLDGVAEAIVFVTTLVTMETAGVAILTDLQESYGFPILWLYPVRAMRWQ